VSDKPWPVPCPECDGVGGVLVDSMTLYGIPGGEDWDRCETCRGTGEVVPQQPTGQGTHAPAGGNGPPQRAEKEA
jgi:DnaJ-class molecular chaperone